MKGYVHSVETLGTVDGPGIRYVVFLQGCPMRCQYCHNPDTWKVGIGKQMEASELISEYQKYKTYMKRGGITVTGGEPLLQMDFVMELFELAKKENIHTCIDTSGICFQPSNLLQREKLEKLMDLTDLILLDLKHIDDEKHKDLTGHSNQNIIEFAKFLSDIHKPVWIRHVVVPTITDDEVYLTKLGEFLGTLKNIKALDVLPYHTMGVGKYESMGMEYPLKHLSSLSKEEAIKARNVIVSAMQKVKNLW